MVGNEDKKWAVVVDEGPICPSTVWNMNGSGEGETRLEAGAPSIRPLCGKS